jgi:hypothetical protein
MAQQLQERIDKWDCLKLKSSVQQQQQKSGHQIKEAAPRLGENLCQLCI